MKLYTTSRSLFGVLFVVCASRATFAWQVPPDRKQPVLLAEEIKVPVSTGSFTFSQITWLPREKGSYTPRITGRVTNNTGKHTSATFEIQLLGDKGQPLLAYPWMKESYSRDDGQTVPLFEKAPDGYGLAKLNRSDQHRVSGVEIHWKKDYEFSLVKPVLSEELVCREDGLMFAFAPGTHGIALTLQNGTEKPVKIDWNQVTYIGIGGDSSKVIHEGVRFIQADSPIPPTVVPPSAKTTDMIVPTFALKIRFGTWTVEDTLPSGRDAPRMLGQNIGLFLPVDIDGKVKNFLFTFKITQTPE